MSVDYGEWSIWSHCQTRFDWSSGQVESYLIHALSEKAKSDKSKVRTRADRPGPSTLLPSEPD